MEMLRKVQQETNHEPATFSEVFLNILTREYSASETFSYLILKLSGTFTNIELCVTLHISIMYCVYDNDLQ